MQEKVNRSVKEHETSRHAADVLRTFWVDDVNHGAMLQQQPHDVNVANQRSLMQSWHPENTHTHTQ